MTNNYAQQQILRCIWNKCSIFSKQFREAKIMPMSRCGYADAEFSEFLLKPFEGSSIKSKFRKIKWRLIRKIKTCENFEEATMTHGCT